MSARALALQFGTKCRFRDAALDKIFRYLEVTLDLETQLAQFLHHQLRTLEFLLPQFLEIKNLLRHTLDRAGLRLNRRQQLFLVRPTARSPQRRKKNRPPGRFQPAKTLIRLNTTPFDDESVQPEKKSPPHVIMFSV